MLRHFNRAKLLHLQFNPLMTGSRYSYFLLIFQKLLIESSFCSKKFKIQNGWPYFWLLVVSLIGSAILNFKFSIWESKKLFSKISIIGVRWINNFKQLETLPKEKTKRFEPSKTKPTKSGPKWTSKQKKKKEKRRQPFKRPSFFSFFRPLDENSK